MGAHAVDVDGRCPPEHRAAMQVILDGIILQLELLDELVEPDEVELLHEVIEELRAIDFAQAGPDTREALRSAWILLRASCDFEQGGRDPETVYHVLRMLIEAAATLAHDYAVESGRIAPGNDVEAAERICAHWQARYHQTRQVFKRDRRHRRARATLRVRQRAMCERRPRQRVGARRAAGVRSGQDPGEEDGERPGHHLTLAKRRAILAFGCERCPHCGYVLTFADGRLVCPNRNCRRWAA